MEKRKKRIIVAALFALAVGVAAVLYVGSTRIAVREFRCNLPGWKSGDDGYSIAVLSDPHFADGDIVRARRIAELTNGLKPDIIVLLGDFVKGNPDRRRSIAMNDLSVFVRSLKAPAGVYAVTGNHELWYGRDHVIAALADGGAVVATGKTITLDTPSGGRLRLIGMPDCTTEPPPEKEVSSAVAPALPTLALMHDPNSVSYLPENFGLGLAGHTHGGQLRLSPSGVSLFSLMKRLYNVLGWLPRGEGPYILFDRWLTGYRGRRVLISSGLGGDKFTLRTFCPPEILLVRLYANDPAASANRFVEAEELEP